MGVIRFQQSLYRQVDIELLEIDAFGKLLIGRIGLIIYQPLGGRDAIARDAGIGDKGSHTIRPQRRNLLPRLCLFTSDRLIGASEQKHREHPKDARHA